MRARAGLVSLRSPRGFTAIRWALAAASSERFRIVHFSVQSDHLHAIVEAQNKAALERGLRGLAIRVARAVNRALGRRTTALTSTGQSDVNQRGDASGS
jgi:putative transposase